MIYWIAHFFFRKFFEIHLSLKAINRKKVPRGTGYLVASNHLSNLDPMLLGVAANRHFGYVAKSTLFKGPLASFFLRQVGAFPLRRGSFDAKALKEALRRLDKKWGIVMFPQGTRNESLDAPAKPGIGFLAAKAHVPIVPACIFNSDKAMPPGSQKVCKAKVTVVFGDPFKSAPGADYQQVANQARDAIKSLLAKYSSVANSR
jgi:1-acyl-sn-glycerol-3-phosphate acyltransferase